MMRRPPTGAALARRLAWAALLGLLLAAAVRSARSAAAAYLFGGGSGQGVVRAARLAPANARYRARLAALLDLPGGSPAEAVRQWEWALRLNPRDASTWIALGLRREADGDLASAERCLLEAARVDATYQPRWTLAGHYFRRGHGEKFWTWAERAAARAHGDPTPLFRLCSQTGGDPSRPLEMVAAAGRPLLAAYLDYLMRRNELDAAYAAAGKLAEGGCGDGATSRLIWLCERLMASGQVPRGVTVWNALAEAGCIPHAGLKPEQGRSLTNPDFQFPPAGGFDWHMPVVEGIAASRRPEGLRLVFSGEQPESGEILAQSVPLVQGRRCRFEFVSRAEGARQPTGLAWRIEDAFTRGELARAAAVPLGAAWKRTAVEFLCPDGTRLARLALAYRRAPGTTRLEGTVWVRGVALGPVP
jgi:hypothetical protein